MDYTLTEETQWNADIILAQTNSIKELLSFEFNNDADNIARNYKILVLLYEQITKLQIELKHKGVI